MNKLKTRKQTVISQATDRIALSELLIEDLKQRHPFNYHDGTDSYHKQVRFIIGKEWAIYLYDNHAFSHLTNEEVFFKYVEPYPVKYEQCRECLGDGKIEPIYECDLDIYPDPVECPTCQGKCYAPIRE